MMIWLSILPPTHKAFYPRPCSVNFNVKGRLKRLSPSFRLLVECLIRLMTTIDIPEFVSIIQINIQNESYNIHYVRSTPM